MIHSLRDRFEQAVKLVFLAILKIFVRSKMLGPIQKESIKNILIVRQHDQLGDMLCAVPLFRALRVQYPNAHITLIASSINYEVMVHHPYLNEVLHYHKQVYFKNPLMVFNFTKKIRKRKYDVAIVPSTVSVSLTSNLLAVLSGASRRIGPKSLMGQRVSSSFMFTHGVELNWQESPRRHQSLKNLDILQPLGIQTDDLTTVIGFTQDERETARTFLAPYRSKYRFIIGCHPGAGKGENRWSAEQYALLANRLQREFNSGIIITAGPMDDDALQVMQQHLRCEALILHNKPIREVAVMIDQLDLFISNDTGIMHVAAATRTNILTLFGPTDPLQWAPIGIKNRYIVSRDSDMTSITLDEVYDMVTIILKEIDAKPR